MPIEPIIVNHLLDQAVATVAQELLPPDDSLSRDVSVRVCGELERIRNRTSDFVDPVVPVLYSTWYQLGHINLGLVVARRLLKQWRCVVDKDATMDVVDIGCGTLSLPIAFNALRFMGQLDANVRVRSVEPSREMEYLGRRILHLFRRELAWFRSEYAVSVDYGNWREDFGNGQVAFSMMHSMYPGLNETLAKCLLKWNPIHGIATVNATERNKLSQLDNEQLGCYRSTEFEP